MNEVKSPVDAELELLVLKEWKLTETLKATYDRLREDLSRLLLEVIDQTQDAETRAKLKTKSGLQGELHRLTIAYQERAWGIVKIALAEDLADVGVLALNITIGAPRSLPHAALGGLQGYLASAQSTPHGRELAKLQLPGQQGPVKLGEELGRNEMFRVSLAVEVGAQTSASDALDELSSTVGTVLQDHVLELFHELMVSNSEAAEPPEPTDDPDHERSDDDTGTPDE